jgi:hypothetical protein
MIHRLPDLAATPGGANRHCIRALTPAAGGRPNTRQRLMRHRDDGPDDACEQEREHDAGCGFPKHDPQP